MSSQKILDAIIDQARLECDEIVAGAEVKAEQSRTQAMALAAEREARQRQELDRECADISSRARQNALLAARKNTLAAKRGLIDRVFDMALKNLCALEGEEYCRLVCRLVCQGSETGAERVLVPENHRVRFEKPYINGKTMLEAINQAYAEKQGRAGAFTMCDSKADFDGGVKLIGDSADIDCSFAALLSEWREQKESKAYSMLFEKEA